MNIYPVKPHKRTILNASGGSVYVNIPKSSFIVKNKKIYYGIIQHDCLIATNLGLALNCGDWRYDIKNDKDLINKFWNTTFPIEIDRIPNIEMDIYCGYMPLKYNYNIAAIQNIIENVKLKFNGITADLLMNDRLLT